MDTFGGESIFSPPDHTPLLTSSLTTSSEIFNSYNIHINKSDDHVQPKASVPSDIETSEIFNSYNIHINKSDNHIQLKASVPPDIEANSLIKKLESSFAIINMQMQTYNKTRNNAINKLNTIFEGNPELKDKYLKTINLNDFDISTSKEVSDIEEIQKLFNNIISNFSSKFTQNEINYILSSDKIKDKIFFISNLVTQLMNENQKFQRINEEVKNKQEIYKKESENNFNIKIKKLQDVVTQLNTEITNQKKIFKSKKLKYKKNIKIIEDFIFKREDDIKQKDHKVLSKIKSMNDIKKSTEKKHREATVLLEQKDREIEGLKSQLNNNTNSHNKIIRRFQSIISIKEKEITCLKEALEKKNEENKKLNDALEKEVGGKKGAKNRSLSRKKSIANLTQRIIKKDEKIKEKEEEINNNIQKENKLSLEELTSVREEGKVKKDRENDLLEKIKTLSKKNQEKDELIQNYINEINYLMKKESKSDEIHQSKLEEKNKEIEKLKRELKTMTTKFNEAASTTINKDKEINIEKETDFINSEVHEKSLNEEEEKDSDEIIKKEFNTIKKSINKISKIIDSKKEKNPEDFDFLKPLIEKFSNLAPVIQNQLEKKCSLISSNLCQFDSNDDNDSLKMIKLSCGHYYHRDCLKLYITIRYFNIEEITPNLEIECPSCNENSKDSHSLSF
ncbi:hypothetical protein LY90DRAFT_510831 [Neocallimastix californiae]|uniref:RING-type domain-containing protein n=1 Tax=Neocallimastix californiae TaxID=1754190 RepID=A0A1Y2BVR3_9FUNG|nr:hypothetical protein LY90DRAFT_510831 [Neocallimastix californiae]|eukprot:ORY38717.1 hypothetical protein LY90DRAFT_510831 [Neocallimastix californiae]